MWHPWRRLRELAHVKLEWQDVDDELGHAEEDRVTITVGLTQAERRSTLTHELIHLERGIPADEYHDAEDLHVRRLTAERLIPIDDLVNALLWSLDHHEVADELWVDVGIVHDRLEFMTRAEWRWIEAELDRRGALP